MLIWNKFEFVECFGVLPKEADDRSFSFRVEKADLYLNVIVLPHAGNSEYGGDFCIELYNKDSDIPLFFTKISDSPAARFMKYPNGWECVEIAAPCRKSYHEDEWLVPMGVRIQIEPRISIEMFQPAAV